MGLARNQKRGACVSSKTGTPIAGMRAYASVVELKPAKVSK